MNVAVEYGFAAVLRPSMQGIHVRQATSSDILPGDIQAVIVECPEIEHVAGPLHRATVKIHIGTPAFDMGEAQHREATGFLANALLDQGAATALFDGAAGGLALRGFRVRSQSEEIIEGAWRSTIDLVAGIEAG
jgi:hypothetical protein